MTEYMSELKVETTELKLCPFFGGKAGIYSLAKYEKEVYCENCGTVSDIYETSQKAIEAWNRRDERTCHNYGGEEGTNGELYDFACSACGFMCDLPDTRYCPSCGAKVVEQCHNVVLDADGVEIRVGDTVYAKNYGYVKCTVLAIEWFVDGYLVEVENEGGHKFRQTPDEFTHQRPDSWERLEEDASKEACEYFAHMPCGCETSEMLDETVEKCNAAKARDLVRRAKKLAGVSDDADE